MVGVHLFFLWSIRERIARGAPDFTIFYTAGKILRAGEGRQLYDLRTQERVQAEFAAKTDLRRGPLPYIHPPFEALLFVPLTYLPYGHAFLVWSFLNLLLLVLVAYELRKSFTAFQGSRVWLLLLALCAFFPVLANFHQGQDAILLLFLVSLVFGAVKRESLFAAGCLLGLGIFKYHLIVPLALELAAWHGLRFIAGFLTASSAASVLSLGLVGWRGAMEYPSLAWHVVSAPELGGIPFHRLPNLLGLIGGWSLPDSEWKVKAVVVVASVALLIAAIRSGGSIRNQRAYNLGFGSAVIVAVLVGYSTNTYDLCLLVLPLAIVADYFLHGQIDKMRPRIGLWGPALLLCVSPIWFFLWMKWEHLNLIAALLLWLYLGIRSEIAVLKKAKSEASPLNVG